MFTKNYKSLLVATHVNIIAFIYKTMNLAEHYQIIKHSVTKINQIFTASVNNLESNKFITLLNYLKLVSFYAFFKGWLPLSQPPNLTFAFYLHLIIISGP